MNELRGKMPHEHIVKLRDALRTMSTEVGAAEIIVVDGKPALELVFRNYKHGRFRVELEAE